MNIVMIISINSFLNHLKSSESFLFQVITQVKIRKNDIFDRNFDVYN